MTPERWARIGPQLDALLDLDGDARSARLAALRADDPALADELAALLARDAALAGDGFLARPAVAALAAQDARAAPAAGGPAPAGEETANGLAALAGLDEADAARAGQAVGPYTLEAVIGRGGMGSVWRARRSDGRYDGVVAIKFLHGGGLGAGGAGRFAREGAILARLAHPHIARLLDAGVGADGRQPYLVLEHVDGLAIDRWCDGHRLDTAGRVRLLLDVLAAVAHAHNRLILHRDLKPSNILVTADGVVKLLDFGIAKLLSDAAGPAAATELTRQAGAAYTPHYAAPEQVQGGEVTTATDVYALGVLLYGLLGGGHPTTATGAGPVERLRSVVEVAPRRLSDAVRQHGGADAARRARALRGDLDTIAAKALKKDPAARYANAAALADDLRRWLRREPIAARPDSRVYRLTRFAQRHRGSVAAGLLVALSLAGGLGLALWQGHEAQRQRDRTEALVGFMLGDLRERLEPVGRLDVLDALGEQVLQHYAASAGPRPAPAMQRRRADALLLLGDVAEKRRRLDAADQRYQQAAELSAALLADDPHDGATLAIHLDALAARHDLLHLRGQRDALPPLVARMRPLAERLRAIDPANLDWRWRDAMLAKREGISALDALHLDAALAAFRRAEALLQPCLDARPLLSLDMAQVLGFQSRTLELRNDLPAALALNQAKQAVLLRTPDLAQDLPVQVDLVSVASEIARLRQLMGEHAAAARGYAEALARSDQLLARDPDNGMWLRQGINLRIHLAGLAIAQRDWPTAARLNTEAQRQLDRVLDQPQPERFFRQVLLGHVLAQRGQRALGDAPGGDRPAAAQALAGYLDATRALEAGGQTLDINELRALALALLALGDLRAAAGQADAARAHWQDAAARSADAPQRHDALRSVLLAEARLRLGDRAGAAALADAVTALRPHLPALQALRQRLAAAAPGAAPH